MTMLSWAFTAAWWAVKLGVGTAGFVANAIAWLLSLPFRLVMLGYRLIATCLLSGLKLVDMYWRVLVIEKAMLFSWIIYELVFSLSLLILLKATHAFVWFFRRALWACHIFPEGQGWRKLLKSVSPGPDALCSICLEPFLARAPQDALLQRQHASTTEDCCSVSHSSAMGEDAAHLQDTLTSTDDCCTSQPSSASLTPSFITHPSPHAYVNDMLQPATSGLSTGSLSRSTADPQYGTSLMSGQRTSSSLSNPYSAASFSDATSGLSGYTSDIYSDDSSSHLQPPLAAATSSRDVSAAPLSAPLIFLFWLPRPCRVLFLRLLLSLRSSSQHDASDSGPAASLAGPPAASSACELPCGHTFCRPCVTRWLERHQQTCPLCRRSIHPTGTDSRLHMWLASTSVGRRAVSAAQPLARVARAAWSLLMALVLCGPFMYAWYYAVRLAGARVGVYHHLLSQSAWADFALCLVLFVRVLHRRCSLDSGRVAS